MICSRGQCIWLNLIEKKTQWLVTKFTHKVIIVIHIKSSSRFIGENAFTCWAFSCASMLRVSCLRLIRQCHELSIIYDEQKRNCEEFISSEAVHVHIRNLTMMILLPRKLHMDDDTQGAYLRAAVSRVNNWKLIHPFTLDC